MSFYFIKKNGVDVEMASNLVDLLLKKTGLDALIPLLESLIQTLLQSVTSYPMFMEVKKKIDEILEGVINILSMIKA